MADPGQRPAGSRGLSLLHSAATLSTRWPRLVVGVWLVVMIGLGLMGRGVEDKVSTGAIFIHGSASKHAHEIVVREFGGEDPLVLMLRGPRGEVNRQGPALVAKLQGLPDTNVLSPWNAEGAIDGLRPSPDVAALLVSVGQSPEVSSSDVVPLIQGAADEAVRGKVKLTIAGGPAIVDSLRESVARAITIAERLAFPVLLIVLLLVFRSVLAAALPVVVGGLVVNATRGVMNLSSGVISIDSIALGTAGMIGLALGIDYSLLIVARFRQEMEKHGDVERAVRTTVINTGRSIIPAGTGLVIAMLVSLRLMPGSFVNSVVLSVVTATVLSVLSAMLLTPAALTLLGSRLDRWSLPRRRESGSLVMAWSRRASRRPGVVLGLIFFLMLCGAWAFTLQSNIGVSSLLPPDDPGRLAQEEIERELGSGWVAPFEVVMVGGNQPVTTPKRLKALADFQHRVERDPGVAAMAGFVSLEGATKALGSVGAGLASQERGITRLGRGLARVQEGTGATSDGFFRAADGARQLDSAVGASRAGSGLLADGLQTTASGSARLSGGLDRASDGSGKLTGATAKVSRGVGKLSAKVSEAQKQTAASAGSSRTLKNALRLGEQSLDKAPLEATDDQLTAAWRALQQMTAGRGDSQYAAAVEAVRAASRELTGAEPDAEEGGEPSTGVAAAVQEALDQFNLSLYLAERQDANGLKASEGMAKLAKATAKLDHGLDLLLHHSRELSDAMARLSAGGGKLPPGLRRLALGSARLLDGLGQIESGAGRLAGGLGSGAERSQRLTAAVGRLRTGVTAQAGSRAGSLSEESPGLFRSGYFYLAGLDGTPPERHDDTEFLVNVAQGGSAARMLVVPTDLQASSGAEATGARLTDDAAELARETDSEVVVGGLSPSLVDLNSAFRGQTPLARLILSMVTILILLPVTRSLTLPIIAALLNLLTVSATFGLMSLLFNDSLLGGPGFVDTVVIPATVILTFGLAIDYEVFIFARIREEYVRSGSTAMAIEDGVGKTAHVISGAALIMIGVFLAFSVSDLANFRNLGVGLSIGVVIDAFIIRFVLLPAIMRALGDRCWWIPGWLNRIIPGGAMPPRAGVEA